ncbi:MAG: trypsin-like peptidase domain-containing protein [Gammaproteobacteria bacterium]|nr:trypsin-like peptidase domain-containing protein [Gammaproteobacteria bacterium]
MSLRNATSFISKAILAGLLLAFVVLYLYPSLLGQQQQPAVITTQAPAAPAVRGVASYADAVALAAPAVVNINTTKLVAERNPFLNDPFLQRFFDGRSGIPRSRVESSLGSGVIVSPQGYVLTNNHVIEGADDIQVALNDGRNAKARIVGRDPESDIAVLQLDIGTLPAITFGESDALRVGDVVLAIGNPYGVGQTVTQGIVSATGRTHLGLSTFENFIQTDAAINPGNSGGALIDSEGHLVGLNSAIFSRSGGSQGIGFAIPASLVRGVMQQIIEHGHAVRGWLGIEVQAVTPALAESFGLGKVEGVIVAGVQPNGPASKAGIRPGDVVLFVNDAPVNDPAALVNVVAGYAPGTIITLRGLREGSEIRHTPAVGERPTPTSR